MIHYDHGYSTPYMHCVVRDLLSGNPTACLVGVLRTVRGGEGVACPSVGRLDSRQVALTGRIPPICGVHSGAPTRVKHKVGSEQPIPSFASSDVSCARDYPVVPVARGKVGATVPTVLYLCTAGHEQPHQLTTPRPYLLAYPSAAWTICTCDRNLVASTTVSTSKRGSLTDPDWTVVYPCGTDWLSGRCSLSASRMAWL